MGSSRSGQGRFQWIAVGGKLCGKAPNWLFVQKVMQTADHNTRLQDTLNLVRGTRNNVSAGREQPF